MQRVVFWSGSCSVCSQCLLRKGCDVESAKQGVLPLPALHPEAHRVGLGSPHLPAAVPTLYTVVIHHNNHYTSLCFIIFPSDKLPLVAKHAATSSTSAYGARPASAGHRALCVLSVPAPFHPQSGSAGLLTQLHFRATWFPVSINPTGANHSVTMKSKG